MILFNGKQVTSDLNITPHFTWGEATKNMSRVPTDPKVMSYIKIAATYLEALRLRYDLPFIVQSWYRDPQTNKSVGGAPNSLHLTGLAIDFHIKGYDMEKFYNENSNHPGGLGYYPSSGHWCHIDFRNVIGKRKARWII